MHSLETEIRELRAGGILDAAEEDRLLRLDSGRRFSVHAQLAFLSYAGVASVVTGVGLILKEDFDRIGPLTICLGLAALALVCIGAAVRTQWRGGQRSLAGDYVLLLGVLIGTADIGFAESQFHWFGEAWTWHLLWLALLQAALAYWLDSRLVLGVALTTLAAWFGLETHLYRLFDRHTAIWQYGLRAIACALLVLGWRQFARMRGWRPGFGEVYEHFAAHLGFAGALALSFDHDWRLAGLALLAVAAWACMSRARRLREVSFAVYAILYAALGLCVVSVQVLREPLLSAMIVLCLLVGSAVLLWNVQRELREGAA
ncbi:MAG: hypothetical protein U1F35_03360 [Steroidobacteraceae bacterium]